MEIVAVVAVLGTWHRSRPMSLLLLLLLLLLPPSALSRDLFCSELKQTPPSALLSIGACVCRSPHRR